MSFVYLSLFRYRCEHKHRDRSIFVLPLAFLHVYTSILFFVTFLLLLMLVLLFFFLSKWVFISVFATVASRFSMVLHLRQTQFKGRTTQEATAWRLQLLRTHETLCTLLLHALLHALKKQRTRCCIRSRMQAKTLACTPACGFSALFALLKNMGSQPG